MICCGDRASVSIILFPFILTVEMMDLISAKTLPTLECTEGSQGFHTQLHHAQVPFGLIVGEGNCEVRKESKDVIAVVAQADQKIVTWPFGFSASSAGSSSQWVLSLMEGKPLSEDRHVFYDDALINRRGDFGLASALRSTLELIGAVEQQAHRTRPRLLFDLFDSLEFA